MTSSGSKQPATAAAASSVVVKPQAFVSIALHAKKHAYESVHGILLGRREAKNSKEDDTILYVTDAVPVSHGNAPTKPIVEMAIGLVEASADEKSQIVGWYTAPMLKDDKKAGPVALRIAASLKRPADADHRAAAGDPVLVVVQNEELGNLMEGDGSSGEALKAYGRDFGGQWLEDAKLTVEDSAKARKATREAASQNIDVIDFVDHLETDISSPSSQNWYHNKEIASLVSKC